MMDGKGEYVMGAILLGLILVFCVAHLVLSPSSYPERYLLTSAFCVWALYKAIGRITSRMD